MAAKPLPRIFVDTNVFQDVLIARSGYTSSIALLELVRQGKITVGASSITPITLAYLSRKSPQVSAQEVQRILRGVELVSLTSEIIKESYGLRHCADLEDEVQYASAVSFQADMIITRNGKDFAHSKVPVMTPEVFLSAGKTK